MKKCKCGNTISLQRQEEGIDHCPACDPPWQQDELNQIIDDIEIAVTFEQLKESTLHLAKFIKESML